MAEQLTLPSIGDQVLTDRYAIYHGDSRDVMAGLPDASVGFSIYSPPFAGLYQYSSDERDLSNSRSYDEFFEHYRHLIREKARVTMPGRISAVHTAPIPTGNTGKDAMRDFPGHVIRAHEEEGWDWVARYAIWKEPLGVRNRTMAKNLAHKTVVDDASRCSNAAADELLIFRRHGDNPVPIAHPTGFTEYAGSRTIPRELHKYRGWTGKQTGNRFSHWIWRQYASAFWDDIRLDRVLPFREARDEDDEKHVHPLQLDVIHRGLQLWSNPGDTVLTPFMGVGSEVYESVRLGRVAIGAELKRSYFVQAVRNLDALDREPREADGELDLVVTSTNDRVTW